MNELMADDGSMLRGAQLVEFAARHNLAYVHIGDLVAHRRAQARLAPAVAQDALGGQYLLPDVQAHALSSARASSGPADKEWHASCNTGGNSRSGTCSNVGSHTPREVYA